MKSNRSSISTSNSLEPMYNFQQRQLLSPTISINLNSRLIYDVKIIQLEGADAHFGDRINESLREK